MEVTRIQVNSSSPCSGNSKKQEGAMCEQNNTEENSEKNTLEPGM